MNGTSDDLYNFITYTLWDQSKESNISYTIRDKDTEKLLACGLLLTEEQMPKVNRIPLAKRKNRVLVRVCVCVCVSFRVCVCVCLCF